MSKLILESKVEVELNPKAGLDESKLVLSFYEKCASIETFDCFDSVTNRFWFTPEGLEKIRKLKSSIEIVETHIKGKLNGF